MRDNFLRALTTFYMFYAMEYPVFFVFEPNPKAVNPLAQRTLRNTLIIHKRYHRYVGIEPCNLCYRIMGRAANLRKYVPEQDLYPPFNPIDSWRKKSIRSLSEEHKE